MAHEMIHALHAVKGTFVNKAVQGRYYTLNTNELTRAGMEEILTTGFEYKNEKGIRVRRYFEITENSIRKENGLELRVTY